MSFVPAGSNSEGSYKVIRDKVEVKKKPNFHKTTAPPDLLLLFCGRSRAPPAILFGLVHPGPKSRSHSLSSFLAMTY